MQDGLLDVHGAKPRKKNPEQNRPQRKQCTVPEKLACGAPNPGFQRCQGLEHGVDHVLPAREQFVGAARVQVAEGRLVERGGTHHTPRRELVDHHLDEADPLRREAAIVQELRERRLGRHGVQADQAAHEVGERWRLAAGQQIG